MSDQSSTQLEREAEAAREKVAGTAESIRNKLTAGQLIDEFAGMFTGGDVSGAVRNLKSQVRDNPLPIALVGAGVAWLAFGKGVSPQNSFEKHFAGGPTRSRGVDMASRPTDGDSTLSSVAKGARKAATSVGEKTGEMTDSLSSTAERIRHSMLTGTRHNTQFLENSVSNAAQEPLLIAALGLTVGAMLGAMLPASDLENEQIGPHADRLREEAKEMVDRGLDSAGRVASKAYDALKEEADRQGLAPGDGPSIGERAGDVIRSAAQSAEDAARDELGMAKDDQQKT